MEEMLLFWLIDYKMAQKTLSANSVGKSDIPCEHGQHVPRYVFEEFPEICPLCESDAPDYVIFSFIPFAEMRNAGDKKQRSLLQTAKREQKEGKFMVPQPFYGCRECLRERFLISYSEEAVKAIFDHLLLGTSNVTVIVKQPFNEPHPFERGITAYYTDASTVEEALASHTGVMPELLTD